MRGTVLMFIGIVLLSPGQVVGQAPAAGEDRAGRVDALNRQAVGAFRGRDFRTAEDCARKAWELCGAGAGGRDAGFAAANLAAALTMQGRLEEALQWQGRAEEVFAREGDADARGRLAVARVVTFYLAGKEEEALATLDRVRELTGKDDVRLAGIEVEVRGNSNDGVQMQAGYMKCLETLNACRAKGDASSVALYAMRMGCMEGGTGGHSDALKYYTEALQVLRAEGDTARAGLALRNIGLACRKLGKYPESEAALREALDLARACGDRRLTVEVLNDMSMLYAEMGDGARAQTCDQEAEAALRVVAEDLRQGRLNDTVLLDFYKLLQVRYANLPPYYTDLFVGFYDQLVLEPPR